jgi:hypothetical protein
MACITGPAVDRGRAELSVASGHDAVVDIPDGAAVALLDHAVDHCLGEEEDRPVQFEVGVVGGAVVVQERLGDERS